MAKKEIEHTSTTLGNQDMKGSQRMVSVVEPYELPEGWKWCRLGEVAKFERGITFPASAKEKEKNENNIPCLRTANVQENIELEDLIYVNKSFMKNNIKKLIQNNDIVFSSANSRELVGKSAFISNVSFPMTFGGFILCIRATNSNSKFLFYFLRLHFLLGRFMGKSTQTTNIANINTETLSNIIIPLPPTQDEQQRIVNRIESMFAKLDEAKEKAQNVVDGFETRKAAILHKAFTGELTAKWRKENGVSDDSWVVKTIGEICLVKGGKRVPKGMSLIKEKNEHPYLKAGNLKFGTVIDKDMEYVPNDVFILIKNYTVNAGDVYITNVGACIGDCGIIPDYYHGASLTENAVKLTEMICINSYLAKQLSSNLVQTQIKSKIKSATLGKLSIDNIKQLKINLPTLPEQQEIVRILDIIIGKERIAKQAAEAVLEQIDLLKKSILARAFRGEL